MDINVVRDNQNPGISVIIPIYNAAHFLPLLFNALDRSAFTEEDEILLVDNGSSDESAKLCREQADKHPALYRCLSYTETAGSYAARNYALQQARGDILVFTDSDCKPTADWLQAIRQKLTRGTVLAGRIQIEIADNGIWEHFDTIAHLNSEANAKKNRVATANMAVYREDFHRVGLFEERFSGGDYEWSGRAARSGLQVVYVPEAMVYHPSRKTFAEILKKEQRIAYGAGNHHKLQGKSLLVLICIYILKIFKLDTNLRYTKRLKAAGFGPRQLWLFNLSFMRIRIEQLKFAVRGYRQTDIRRLGVQ